MRTVKLEEKLIAQMKNISEIIKSENTTDVKLMLLFMQKEYFDAMFDEIVESIRTK